MAEKIKIHAKACASLVDDLRADVAPVRFKFDPLYSGGPAFIDGFDAPAFVDLSTLRLDPNPKALLEHDPAHVVGRLENIQNDGRRLTCDAVIGGNATASRVVEWARNVATWSASIGVYRFTDNDVETVASGARANVNGREVCGPAYIVHNGSLAEGSFVAIGGDGEARTVLAKLTKGGSKMGFFKRFTAEGCGPVEDDKEKEIAAELTDDEKEIEAEIEGDAQELAEIVADAVEQAVEDAGEVIPEEVAEEVAEEVVEELAGEGLEPVAAALRASKLAARKIRAKMTDNNAGTLAESRRVAGINALTAAYGSDAAKVAASAIANGWSIERTERIMKAHHNRREFVAGMKSPGFGGTARTDGPTAQNVVAASFAKTLGLDDKRAARAFGEAAVDAATAKGARDFSFRHVVAASLNSYAPGSVDFTTGTASAWNDCKAECRRASLLRGSSFRAGASFSTISATDVFQLVLQAFLEPSEETAPRAYSQLTRENKVVDFNAVKSYLPTIKGRLQQISETGAISNVGMTTQEFTRSATPYAATFTIPEITIINDQIDAFAELLRQLEQLGEDCIEHDVAATFWRLADGDIVDASGAALVSGSVGNYITGGSLNEAGLSAAIAALNSFSTANGVPLASDNLLLVSGSKLSPTARKLANAGYVDFQNGTAYPNVFQGRFKPIEWAYLDSAHARAKKDNGSTDSLFAGDKTWLLLRDPQRRPAVVVNKVVGFESPRVEQFDADPNVWGTSYRYVYPYGVGTQYKDAIVATTNS